MEDSSSNIPTPASARDTSEAAAPTISVAGAAPAIAPDRDTDQLKVTLGEFEGPLDLLLYLNLMQELDLAVAGDFLVMAAQLIELKSRMLLPRDPLATEEEVEDPRTDLVNRLLEHEKFKAAAQMLWSRATVEQAVFKRAEIETDKNNPEVAVGLFDLLTVFQKILARHKEEVLLEIEREEVTMAEMIERLRNMVRSAGELNLMEFFERAQSRRELVVAFLSVLELVRLAEISLMQRETFGEIIARAVDPT